MYEKMPHGQLNRKLNIEDVKGRMEETFLLLLENGNPVYGWKFKKYIKDNFGVTLSPSEYHPMFDSLEEGGIVRSESVIVNGRNRRMFYPVPFKTREYLESLRNTNNRNTATMNKISRGSLSFSLLEPVTKEARH